MPKEKPGYKVAIVGYGWVGRAYHNVFPDAVIYDPYNSETKIAEASSKDLVNACDMALVCVPTDAKDGELDMTIVEGVVDWLRTPLILIKSALQPGTVDRLVKKTGKKIAVSVEMVGEGKYFLPFWRYPHPENPLMHSFLIVGGEEEAASGCADVVWARMSPDTNVHLVSAVEAEICKLMENSWGAMKVTFANVIYDICQQFGANYTKVLQAFGSDGRVEKMHMRVIPGKRGWKSKCYDKDVPALAELDKSGFLKSVIQVNQEHLKRN